MGPPDLLDRLFATDVPIYNARAFRALLEELHARADLSEIREPHLSAITMVRAGVLRALIGVVMMLLDPADTRGNRASIGQIVEELKGTTSAAATIGPGFKSAQVPAVVSEYDALKSSDLFESGRRLRNELIAHSLIPEHSTPVVPYCDLYALHDHAEHLRGKLYDIFGLIPTSSDREDRSKYAKVFWKTYFAGIKASDA